MKTGISYPIANEADICLILEGTYPFVKGGVSNWVYELIRVFPQFKFAIIFLGTRKADYEGLCYPISDNVVHIEPHFLFEMEKNPERMERIKVASDKKVMKKVENMHNKFATFKSNPEKISEFYELIHNEKEIKKIFLRSKLSWDFILTKYKEKYANNSFFDYFWGVRNLHYPFWELGKVIDRIPKVKILHSASTGYAGLLGALLQTRYNIPFILTEHGIYAKERWIELMRNYFFEYIVEQYKTSKSDEGLLSMWINFFSILSKMTYDAANPIISLFKEYEQRQINDGASPQKTKIISYGIDFNRYPFLGKKEPNINKPIVALIGRVAPIKDIKTFIRASALIINRNPLVEAWIVGPEDEDLDYVRLCKSLVHMLGLNDKIKFLGYQKVMDIYPKVDLIISSSISEGTPFSILESFAVGIPVVATNVGGCYELIYGKNEEDKQLGVAGRIVNIADPDAIANASLSLLTDKTAWLSAQQVGLARVRKYYSMEELVHNYRLIYEEALSNGRNRI